MRHEPRLRRPSARLLLAAVVLLATAAPALPREPAVAAEDPVLIPFRIRDLTFPSFLILGFIPAPAAALGRGNQAWEVHLSSVNNFQASKAVENHLVRTRADGERRRLSQADADAILALPAGQAFYIDGQFGWLNLAGHFGLTERLDLSLQLNYLTYGGGFLDEPIFDFHDELGFGQQGRQFVEDDQFQVVLGLGDGNNVVALQRPTAGGLSDPFVSLRYAIPGSLAGWRFNLEVGGKLAFASVDDRLSTGNHDVGLQLSADRQWGKNALVLNASLVDAGDFEAALDFDPGVLPSLTLSYLHRFRSLVGSLQVLLAENAFSDLVDSRLSDLGIQTTAGLRWQTPAGVWGVAITENIGNFDNTPDFGVHLTYGVIVD